MSDHEMRRRLASAAETITPSARPTEAFVTEARAIRRRRRGAVAGVVVGVVAVAAVGVGVQWDRWVGADLQPDPAGERDLVVDPVAPSGTSVCSGGVARVFSPAGDGDVVAYGDDCEAVPLVTGEDDDFDPAGSVDGRQVAFVRSVPEGGARLMLLDRASGELSELLSTPSRLGGPEFSPDGTTLSFTLGDGGGTPHVHTLAVAGGEPVRVSDADGRELSATWSPDGTSLTFVREGRLVGHDLASGEENTLDEAPSGLTLPFVGAGSQGDPLLFALRPGADGAEGAKGAETYQVLRLDPATGAVLTESAAYPGGAHDAVVDDEGVHVAASLAVGVIRTFDAEDLDEVTSLSVEGEPALVPHDAP